MAQILDKYKKDNSQTLLDKYKKTTQKPSVSEEEERVSLNVNPSFQLSSSNVENVLPDLTDKEGKVISEEADVFTKILKTGASVGSDLLYGVGKGLEGVVDAVATIVSQFDQSGNVADFIKTDYTGELLGGMQEKAHENSFYKEDSIVASVFQGVGQMLPSIGVSLVATPAVGMTVFGVGAGGTSAEQAYIEGASDLEALAYGTVSGLVETGIELLSGGLGGLGKGAIEKVAPKLATQMAKSTTTKVLVNMAGEGLEEMASEVLNPLMKSIYDNDAIDEYKDEEFVTNVLEAGITGSLCSAVLMGGNVVVSSKSSRIANDIQDLQEQMIRQTELGNKEQANELANEIKKKSEHFEKSISKKTAEKQEILKASLESRLNDLEVSKERKVLDKLRKEKLSDKQRADYESRLSNLENYTSEKLQKMEPKSRAQYITKNAQNYKYTQKGTLKQQYLKQDSLTKAKQDYTSRVMKSINNVSNTKLGLNFTKSNEYNAKIVGNQIYLNKDLLTPENWKKVSTSKLGHEITHSTENKELYKLIQTTFKANKKAYQEAFDAKKERYNNSNLEGLEDYHNMSEEQKDDYIEKEVIADCFGEVLSNEKVLKELVQEDKTIAEKVIEFLTKVKEKLSKKPKAVREQLKEYEKTINNAMDVFVKLLNEKETVGGVVDNDEENKKFSLKEDSLGNKLTKEQIEFFKDSKVVDEQGRLLRMYHGTQRMDRVGYYFDPKRATSGPMAFFTNNKEIATNYSTDKKDTSIDYDKYSDYSNWFTYKGTKTNFVKSWGYFSYGEKQKLIEKASHIRFDDNYENIIYDENNYNGLGGFKTHLKYSNNNAFRALIDEWLNSGTLINEEQKFLQVLKLLNLENKFNFEDPYKIESGVYEVYLNLINPFYTKNSNNELIKDIEKITPKYNEDELIFNSGVDMWDKNTPYNKVEFLNRLKSDIKNGTTNAWTSIPDFVTEYLKEKGFDGILDDGGKMGGEIHLVAIPFNSNQIKLTSNKTPTKTSDDIRYSLKETEIKLDTIRKVEFLSKTAENLIFNRVNVKNKEFNSLIPSLDEFKTEIQTEFRKILQGTNFKTGKRASTLEKLLSKKLDGFTILEYAKLAELGERTQQPQSIEDQKLLVDFLRSRGKIIPAIEAFSNSKNVRIIDPDYLPNYLKIAKDKNQKLGKSTYFAVDKAYRAGNIGGWFNPSSKDTHILVNTGWNVIGVINHENFHSMLGFKKETFEISKKFMQDVENILRKHGDFNQAMDSMALSYPTLRRTPFKYNQTGGFEYNNQGNSLLEEFCCELCGNNFATDIQELKDLRNKFLKDNKAYFVEDKVEKNVPRTSLKAFDEKNFERINFDTTSTIHKVKPSIITNKDSLKKRMKNADLSLKIAITNSLAGVQEAIYFYTGGANDYDVRANWIRAFRNRCDNGLQNGLRSLDGKTVLSKSFDDIFFNWINEKHNINTNEKEHLELKQKFFDYLLHHHNIDRMNLTRDITLQDVTNSKILDNSEKEEIKEYIDELNKERKANGEDLITSFPISFIKQFIDKKHLDLFEADFKEFKSVFGKYTRLESIGKKDRKLLSKIAPEIYKELSENNELSEEKVIELLDNYKANINYDDFNITDSNKTDSESRFKLIERSTGKVIAKAKTMEALENIKEEAVNKYYKRMVSSILKNSLTEVSAEDSKLTIERYEQEHPEFKQHAEDVWQFGRALMELRLEAGLISQELYDELTTKYPHYVPTNREFTSNLGKGSNGSGSANSVSSGIKEAKGSDIVIEPIDVMFARQTRNLYNNIAMNQMANDLYDAKVNSSVQDNDRVKIKKDVVIRRELNDVTGEEISLGEKGTVITFYKNGERTQMEVNEYIAEGFKAINSFNTFSSEDVILNWIGKANKGFKSVVTEYNPFFLLRNFVRDIQDALLYSKNGTGELLKRVPTAIKGIMSNSEAWQEYCALGGLNSSVFDYNSGTVTAQAEGKIERSKPAKGIRKIGDKVARANMIVEQSVRFAEYLTALENGKSQEQAFYESQEITVNFGKSGTLGKKLNRTLIPFLNAQIQGFSKMIRVLVSRKTVKEWASLLLRALLIGITPAMLNYLLYSDDEEYMGLSSYYRDNNYLIKIGDKFIKIPKGRLITVISSAMIDSVEFARGNKDAFKGYTSTVVQAVSPVNDFRTILSPINDVKTNTTWYGGQIESSKFSNIKPSNRYDNSTSIIAKGLGKVLNYSPKKIDYLLDQYSGVVGDVLIPATSSDSKTNAFTFVTTNLTVDSAYKTRYYSDFNDKLTKLQYLKTDGDAIATLQVKYMNKVKSKVSELYDEQRRIEADTTLSKKEKSEQLRAVQLLINNMYNTAYKNVDALGSNFKNLPLTEDSINDDYYYGLYLTFGAETALSLHSDKLYEKAKNLVENSTLTYDDFLLTYFDCKGMRKSEAIQYIQSLSMSKQNKQKLLESLF